METRIEVHGSIVYVFQGHAELARHFTRSTAEAARLAAQLKRRYN